MATKKSRKNPRAQVSLLARYRSPTAFEYVNEECFDLSAGGMFIKSPTPAPTGTLLKLECVVNGGDETLRGVARVVWLRESESDGQPSGMGVKFVKLEQGSREIIHRILVERGSIEPGELEALRPSVAPAAALEARAGSAGGSVGALAARSATLPPEMRATVPDGGLLRESREREVEDITDEVTSAESDPPENASSAPPARVRANGTAAHAGAKAVAAKPLTVTRPSADATPPAPAKQRTGIVVVLVLVAAAAAAAIVLSRPAPAPESAREASPAVTVSVPAPEPVAIEPATPEPSVPAPQPETESASAEPAAPEPREPPARAVAREPERAAAVSRTTPPVQRREAEPTAEPKPAPEPVLVATGSTAAPVALTAEGAPLAATPQPVPAQPAPSPTPAPAAYVLTVVTTPAGAQVTAAGQAGLSPCRFELGALETKVEVQATLPGYSPAVAVIDRIGFMLDDGRMRRRISLTLQELPKPMPDPEPVANKPSRHRSREARETESEPKPAVKAPGGTPMQAAMECLTTGDNTCAVNALEGKARNAQELELLIETYRTLGNSAKAERWMNAYVEKYPGERRANTYRRQLERRQSEAPP